MCEWNHPNKWCILHTRANSVYKEQVIGAVLRNCEDAYERWKMKWKRNIKNIKYKKKFKLSFFKEGVKVVWKISWVGRW